jgi:hypothetical protein
VIPSGYLLCVSSPSILAGIVTPSVVVNCVIDVSGSGSGSDADLDSDSGVMPFFQSCSLDKLIGAG